MRENLRDDLENPLYYEGRSVQEVWARFGTGVTVRTERSRARNYPGLRSEAPSTGVLYDLVAPYFQDVADVADVGCGAGIGTRVLTKYAKSTIGVELDSEAVKFARQYVSSAKIIEADAAFLNENLQFGGAVCVDVLGQVVSPFAVLSGLRARMQAGSRIAIAEPLAYPNQCISNPVRRAFSTRTLTALLAAAGFEVTDWLCDNGTFIACIAVAFADAGCDALCRGSDLAAQGDFDGALAQYGVAAASERKLIQVEALLCQADMYIARGDGDAGCRAYFRARELEPEDPRPLVGLTQIALETREFEDALILGRKAVSLDACEIGAACALALATEAVNPEVSLKFWQNASNLAPDQLAPALKLSETATRMGEHQLAIFALERLRSYGEDFGATLNVALATALIAAGRHNDAKIEARMAMARAPQDPDARRIWNSLSAA